jgi:hypothetical protein
VITQKGAFVTLGEPCWVLYIDLVWLLSDPDNIVFRFRHTDWTLPRDVVTRGLLAEGFVETDDIVICSHLDEPSYVIFELKGMQSSLALRISRGALSDFLDETIAAELGLWLAGL